MGHPVLDGLGQMGAVNRRLPLKIRDGPCHLQKPVATAGREPALPISFGNHSKF